MRWNDEWTPNWYKISFQLEISLCCSVTLLFVLTWIEVKQNSRQYAFHFWYDHICDFDQNEVSNWHVVFMWTEFTQNKMNKHRLLCLMCMSIWNSLQGMCDEFQNQIVHFDRNEISFCLGDKISWSCKHYLKWNVHIKISGCFEMQPKWNFMRTGLVFMPV